MMHSMEGIFVNCKVQFNALSQTEGDEQHGHSKNSTVLLHNFILF